MDCSLIAPPGVRSSATSIERPAANDAAYLQTNDSAFCALTDFRREHPITVDANSSIEDALGDMNRLRVHALLVTRQAGEGTGPQVVGLITYYDVEQRRPHRYPESAASSGRSDVRVGEFMTPCNELPLVKYDSLQSLTAYDLYQMFQGTGLTHLLVIEPNGDESAVARGLVSRAALAKRLRRARAPAL